MSFSHAERRYEMMMDAEDAFDSMIEEILPPFIEAEIENLTNFDHNEIVDAAVVYDTIYDLFDKGNYDAALKYWESKVESYVRDEAIRFAKGSIGYEG